MQAFLRIYMHLRSTKIRREERARLKILEETIETIMILYKEAEQNNEPDKMKIFSTSLFLFSVDYDVSCLKFMIVFQLDNWNKQFLSRQLAVLLYESTKDFLKLLGKEFRDLIGDLPNNESLFHELNEITSDFRSFKNQHNKFLQRIRNYCGAHRDKNGYDQIMIIKSVDPDELLSITAEFMKPVARLIPFFSNVMNTMSNNYK